jgi:hypothetical protein
MKCNQWTLGLAAVGLVSLASVARADSTNAVMTALNSTTLSGYVDTSAEWNLGSGDSHAPNSGFAGLGKTDGINLNVVDLNLEKDPDATDGWGAGYRVELWAGPDASTLGTTVSSGTGNVSGEFSNSTKRASSEGSVTISSAGGLAVKNAYVDLKAPLGNGLDIKIGVWDTIIGYEVADSPNNPNFTRSWGFDLEPTTHTGVLLSYTVNDVLSLQAGIADTFGPVINARDTEASDGVDAESYKTYMGSVSLTAPKDWGFIAGSTLYGCVINGFNVASPAGNGNSFDGNAANQTSWYAGTTMNTPLAALKLGASLDFVGTRAQILTEHRAGFAEAFALYATYQATEKLGLNARAEYGACSDDAVGDALPSTQVIETTFTVQYDLWKNVLARVEARWDHDAAGSFAFGGNGDESSNGSRNNAYELIGNFVYKF